MVKKGLLDKPYKKSRLQNEDILRNKNHPLETSVKIGGDDSSIQKCFNSVRYNVNDKGIGKVYFIKSFS